MPWGRYEEFGGKENGERKRRKKAEKRGLKRGVKLKKRPRRPMDSQGMRYYPAFGVKSGPDALFRRFLGAGSRFHSAAGPSFPSWLD
jgi:hypothetical protein